MQSVVCFVCCSKVPKEFANEHHRRPQAAGGTDKDLVFLCGGCHFNVHQIANMLQTSKASQAEDVIRTFSVYSDSLAAQRRCMVLAREVAHWLQLKKTGHLRVDQDEEVEIAIRLPIRIKNALQREANMVKDPLSGRKAGMARVAAGIISAWVLQRYPALRKDKNQ